MGKRITWKANALICIIVAIGFVLTSVVSYHSNREAFEQDAERTSTLASESAAREIDAQFSQPIDVSLAMARDTLLLKLLDEENVRADDADYVAEIGSYLDAYRSAFGFDSAFLVSAETNRYYHFNGLDRTLETDNDENVWYYEYLKRDEEYSINIDNDEATDDEITVFVNARAKNPDGTTRAVVGVGFRLDDLQALLSSYEEQTSTTVRLVDAEGTIRVATSEEEVGRNLFGLAGYGRIADDVLAADEQSLDTWYAADGIAGYLASRYVGYLDWFLVVDHDTSQLDEQITRQFTAAVSIIAIVMLLVLAATTTIFRRHNKLIVSQTLAVEQKHKTIFQEAAEQLYENIYEVDITHNRAASEATEQYFESLGAAKDMPFDKALAVIAEKQVAANFRQGYLDTFMPAAVLEAHERGVENLSYEFKMTDDGVSYHWIRIYAHVFFWDEDDSVRMLVYRQNIDDEKRRERTLLEQMQHDSLTGLYNKAATQLHVSELLAEAPHAPFAFFILDIDDFKGVNDHLGHDVGDKVLTEFARAVHAQFRPYDIVGRIGGDEFVAFTSMPDAETAERKAELLVDALQLAIDTDEGACTLSASVGLAFFPEDGADFETLYRNADRALYRAKGRGKNRFARHAKDSGRTPGA